MWLTDWVYDGSDPGLQLFTLANARLPAAPCQPTRVLDIGARDTDFVTQAQRVDPRLLGTSVDWRGPMRPGDAIQQGDVLTCALPVADVVVALSTLEHIGLGHYDHDPIDPFGDVKALQRVRDVLAPGGWCYLDVPYDPTGYRVQGTKCRVYDAAALRDRLGPHEVVGYTHAGPIAWVDPPLTRSTCARGFHYVALLVKHHG